MIDIIFEGTIAEIVEFDKCETYEDSASYEDSAYFEMSKMKFKRNNQIFKKYSRFLVVSMSRFKSQNVCLNARNIFYPVRLC